MISDDHLIPSGADFGRPTSASQKQEAPALIFMTQSQVTSTFLAIFVQFPPGVAKAQPWVWHHCYLPHHQVAVQQHASLT